MAVADVRRGNFVAIAVLVLSVILSCTSIVYGDGQPYKYESPPPPTYEYVTPSPPPYVYKSSPPPYKQESPPPPTCKVLVTGNVFCDLCQNGNTKKPLKGVKVGVFCWNGKSEDSYYGNTDDWGNFYIELDGFDYKYWGAKACKAKLISPCYDTPCTIPTELNGGISGADIYLKSESKDLILLTTGPFAYKSEKPDEKCWVSPPYKYQSPPPPTYKYVTPSPPPYVYKSSPPPSKPNCPPPAYKSPSPAPYTKSSPPPAPYKYVSPSPPPYESSPAPSKPNCPPPAYKSPSPAPYTKSSPPPTPYKYVPSSPPPYKYTSPPPPYHY